MKPLSALRHRLQCSLLGASWQRRQMGRREERAQRGLLFNCVSRNIVHQHKHKHTYPITMFMPGTSLCRWSSTLSGEHSVTMEASTSPSASSTSSLTNIPTTSDPSRSYKTPRCLVIAVHCTVNIFELTVFSSASTVWKLLQVWETVRRALHRRLGSTDPPQTDSRRADIPRKSVRETQNLEVFHGRSSLQYREVNHLHFDHNLVLKFQKHTLLISGISSDWFTRSLQRHGWRSQPHQSNVERPASAGRGQRSGQSRVSLHLRCTVHQSHTIHIRLWAPLCLATNYLTRTHLGLGKTSNMRFVHRLGESFESHEETGVHDRHRRIAVQISPAAARYDDRQDPSTCARHEGDFYDTANQQLLPWSFQSLYNSLSLSPRANWFWRRTEADEEQRLSRPSQSSSRNNEQIFTLPVWMFDCKNFLNLEQNLLVYSQCALANEELILKWHTRPVLLQDSPNFTPNLSTQEVQK